jgi:hypothetical protein
VVAIDQPE